MICITGVSGFLGYSLLKNIRNNNVTGIYFKNNPRSKNAIKCDLTNKNEVKKVFDKLKPDIVIHLAALPNPRINDLYKIEAKKLNVGITETLVENLDKHTHIIFTSSDVVFNGVHPYPEEDTPTCPRTYHGNLKVQCENLIRENFINHHIIRLSTIHSFDENHLLLSKKEINSFISIALDKIKNSESVEAFSNIKRCFTKLDELIRFIELLIEHKNYGTYHAGSEMKSYYERIVQLCQENNLDYKKSLIPINGRVKPLMQNLNTSKLENTFKYKFS